jgi:hypothetical protein
VTAQDWSSDLTRLVEDEALRSHGRRRLGPCEERYHYTRLVNDMDRPVPVSWSTEDRPERNVTFARI